MGNQFRDLAQRLREAETPDRRLDSEAALMALAPSDAVLDDTAGIDGWDIMIPGEEGEMEVWLAADEILYATQFVDSAVELCGQAAPQAAPAVIVRALAAVLRRNAPVADGAEAAGFIARAILVELMEELSLSPERALKKAA